MGSFLCEDQVLFSVTSAKPVCLGPGVVVGPQGAAGRSLTSAVLWDPVPVGAQLIGGGGLASADCGGKRSEILPPMR